MRLAIVLLALTAGLSLSTTTQATLIDRGNGLIYDSVLDATWSKDANLFATMASDVPNLVSQIIAAVPVVYDTANTWDNPPFSGRHNVIANEFHTSDGRMSWFGAWAWVGYLNSIDYGGYDDWALTGTDTACGSAYECTNSPLGELFYTGLGGNAGQSIAARHNANYGLFDNIQSYVYWSSTQFTPDLNRAWAFYTNFGDQRSEDKLAYFNVWLMRYGDATAVPEAVPEPGSLALMMGAGLSLLSIRSLKRN